MRLVLATIVAAAALAACGQGGGGAKTEEAGATSPAEEKVATEIVDAGGVLMLGEETLSQVAGGQMQMVVMQNPELTPEQLEQVHAAIRKNMDAEIPALKKEMSGHLTEAFSESELKTYQAFVTAKEGESIQERSQQVMQKSVASAEAMTAKAVEKAIAEVKGAAAPAAPADGAAPASPAKPTEQQ
jgi:hypothetical protein